MKAKWVATLNAGKFNAVMQFVKNSGTVLLLSMLLLIFISCAKSDDLDAIGNEPPIDNESPTYETPPENDSPIDENPPNNEESIIVYTDVEPDFTSENLYDSYGLDLNNDKIVDYTLRSVGDDNYEWLRIASNPNVVNGIISVAPWYTHPTPLNSGKEIFNLTGYRDGEFYETLGVFNIGDCFAGEQGCFYDWKDKVDKYLGLRFIINGQIHYGWAQMDITSVSQWVIKDYAYHATPNKPILAGQRN